jgi:hypothetical protein
MGALKSMTPVPEGAYGGKGAHDVGSLSSDPDLWTTAPVAAAAPGSPSHSTHQGLENRRGGSIRLTHQSKEQTSICPEGAHGDGSLGGKGWKCDISHASQRHSPGPKPRRASSA